MWLEMLTKMDNERLVKMHGACMKVKWKASDQETDHVNKMART